MLDVGTFGVGDQPRDGGVDRKLGAHLALEQALGAGERLADLRLVEILQARLHALRHAPGGDVAAHGAGADHMHAERLEAVFGCFILQHLRQLEHAA